MCTEALEMNSLILSVCASRDTLSEFWKHLNPNVQFSGLQEPMGEWEAELSSVSESPGGEITRAVGYPLANCASSPKEGRFPNFKVKRTKSICLQECTHPM